MKNKPNTKQTIEDGWIEHDLNIICEDCADWGHRCHCNIPEWTIVTNTEVTNDVNDQ